MPVSGPFEATVPKQPQNLIRMVRPSQPIN